MILRPVCALLFAAASLSLSGCIFDHQPHTTVDDRFAADELARRELDGVSARPATLAEYSEVAGVESDAVAFALKLDSDETYRVYLFAKSFDTTTRAATVRLLRYDNVSHAHRASLVAAFFGLSMKARITGATTVASSQAVEELDGATLGLLRKNDDSLVAVNLPPVGDVVRRFAVRRILLTGSTGRIDKVVEVECCILPADKVADESAARDTLQHAVAADWEKSRTK